VLQGWELSVPVSSKHKDLAWELITIMLEPKTLAPWLLKFGYLPTQSVTGEANTNGSQSLSFPYYNRMISMIPLGHVRPSIAEYPMIAAHISQAIKEVLTEGKDARQALQSAASKSAKDLGW
jgi:multiple sugar transport system substrate-binding protein